MQKHLQRLPLMAALAMGACGPASESGGEWTLASEPITIDTSAVYTISSAQSGKCVEVASGSTTAGAALQIATCNGSTRQQFRMEATDSGFYLIKNVNSGQCADVEGVSAADGARVLQWHCWSGANQQWSFSDASNGAARITARHSGKALDVYGGGTADGSRLIQWPWHGGSNQQFRVTRVDSGGSSGSAGCGSPSTLRSGRGNINVSGTNREYIIDIPADYNPSRPYRLVFAWHWRGGSANDVANGGYYDLRNRSNGSAIFVAPQGIDAGWANTGGRDINFTRAMVDRFNSQLCIDQDRIFSTGWSFGGMMSFAVGCAMGDVFRAIAPMSGALFSGCENGTQPVAMWGAHGIYDSVVALDQGRRGRDVFLDRNNCGTQTVPVQPNSCVSYQGCDAGYPVVWCEFGGGHGTPDFAGSAIWNFFSQF